MIPNGFLSNIFFSLLVFTESEVDVYTIMATHLGMDKEEIGKHQHTQERVGNGGISPWISKKVFLGGFGLPFRGFRTIFGDLFPLEKFLQTSMLIT